MKVVTNYLRRKELIVKNPQSSASMLDEITDGRTDLVFDYLAAGHSADETNGGVSLIQGALTTETSAL